MTVLTSRIESLRAYRRAPLPSGVSLRLDANEGPPSAAAIALKALTDGGADLFRRYPDARQLESKLAGRFGIDAERVFVSAGADDVIDRCCRAYLTPGSSLVIAEPGFEMFDHYAALAGARVDKAQWQPGRYPIEGILAVIGADTRVVALVTPNNPTGETATLDDLLAIASASPDALVILDHAYAEFTETDLTAPALGMPNVVVVRTFSKAWGLAGCRVGYALGPTSVIRSLRAAGGPFPASAPSLAVAAALLDHGTSARDAYVNRIRGERGELYALLESRGAKPRRSHGNFVFAELGERSTGVHAALVEQGVLVRTITSGRTALGLRIALPGEPEEFKQLCAALTRALAEGAP